MLEAGRAKLRASPADDDGGRRRNSRVYTGTSKESELIAIRGLRIDVSSEAA